MFARYCLGNSLRIAWDEQDALTKEIEVGPSEHLAFHGFESVDLPLHLTIIKRESQAGEHGRQVCKKALSKTPQCSNPTGLRGSNPVVKVLVAALTDHRHKRGGEGYCLDPDRADQQHAAEVPDLTWSRVTPNWDP